MIENFKNVVTNKYAQFQGRARRREYWLFFLMNIILTVVANLVDYGIGFPILGALISLGLLIPGLALSIRRLHDTNKSGWWLLIALVPFLGALTLLIFFATEGTHGSNNFGPDPKGIEDDITQHLV